jgi:hypothetical protein
MNILFLPKIKYIQNIFYFYSCMSNKNRSPKKYSKKVTYFLIFGPFATIFVILILFTVLNALGFSTNNIGTDSTSQLISRIINYVLGLIGFICVLCLFTTVPYGIYRFIKGHDTNQKIIKEGNLNFIENVRFRSPKMLARIITGLNVLQIVYHLFLISIFSLLLVGISKPGSLGEDVMNFIQTFDYDTWGNLSIFVDVFTVIIFLLWMARVYKNLYAFQVKTFNTPGWVIAGFFIPFLNLFAPYKNMKEIWTNSVGDGGSKLVLCWWVSTLIAGIAGILDRVDYDALTPEELSQAFIAFIFFFTMAVIGLILATFLVRRITEAQEEKNLKIQ